jgi:hypothetical protein
MRSGGCGERRNFLQNFGGRFSENALMPSLIPAPRMLSRARWFTGCFVQFAAGKFVDGTFVPRFPAVVEPEQRD